MIAARRRSRRAICALLTLAVFLAGCAGPSIKSEVSGAPGAVTARWASFEIAGRISARKDEQAFSGSYRWTHAPESDFIELASPLGQTVARLVRDAEGIRLEAGDGHVTAAQDWDSLTERALGWSLPVVDLVFWAQAAPSPATAFRAVWDESHRLSELRQHGWTILYRAYDEHDRPTRMQLDYDRLNIRLAIDAWETQKAN